MNIRLIPFTWVRHVSIGLYVAGVATVVWWVCLNWIALMPNAFVVDQFYEGTFLMVMLSLAIGPSTIFAEGILRRRAPQWVAAQVLLVAVLGAALTGLFVFLTDYIWYQYGLFREPAVTEPSVGGSATAGLTYKLAAWVICGGATGLSVYASRLSWFLTLKLRDRFAEKIPKFINLPNQYEVLPSFYNHVFGGIASGLCAAAVWHTLNYPVMGDFYLASAVGFLTMGFLFGTLVWGIPPDLYSGWFRVLSHHRFGQRLPILSPNEAFSERFIGHFPRGLNLFIEPEHGVAEIHASFVGEKSGRYAVRGLSQSPTVVKRFLERFELSYPPSSPVPLESDLKMEDIIILGAPGAATHLEFLLLPKEEE